MHPFSYEVSFIPFVLFHQQFLYHKTMKSIAIHGFLDNGTLG